HKFFDHTRLNVQLQDRFGIPVNPKEWFLVPLEAIEEVIEKIKEGTIHQFRYDPESASLIRL
ncbi:MAG: GIY-YIG nuclease family protein, partial [Synechococcales cyanobacterium]